jgi:hypothetical protein
VCALSGNLECDIVWGLILQLQSSSRELIEIFGEELRGRFEPRMRINSTRLLTSLDALAISEKAGTDMLSNVEGILVGLYESVNRENGGC